MRNTKKRAAKPIKKVTKPKTKKTKRNKNISSKVRNGTIIQTRDEYFEGRGKYRKKGYENKGLYRKSAVIDSNRSDELALVKLTKNKKGLRELSNKSQYRPYIETKDDEKKPIKLGKKFKATKKTLTKKDVANIKKTALKSKSVPRHLRRENRKKLKKLKGRE